MKEPTVAAPSQLNMGPAWQWIALVIGAMTALGFIALAYNQQNTRFKPDIAVGTSAAVTLTNGQVVFGKLDAVQPGQVVLRLVHEGINVPQANSQRVQLQLVRRQTSAWHAPGKMVIPVDKILFMESVGADSTVGKAISEASEAK